MADNVGNVSAPGTLTVQVDASPPSVEVNCPATAAVGSEAQRDGHRLRRAVGPGQRPERHGADRHQQSRTADDRSDGDRQRGHSTTASCTTQVGNTTVISGNVSNKLIVKSGEAVKLTSTAHDAARSKCSRAARWTSRAPPPKAIKASRAGVMRICGAKVGALKITGSTGPVTIGDGEGCAGQQLLAGATLTGNTGGVSVIGNTFKGTVKVTGNSGGTTVTNNTVGKNLTVTGNSGTVVDTAEHGRRQDRKLQARSK